MTNAAEKIAFLVTPEYQADTLPPIFHYWSARYLAPLLSKFDIRSPEELYFKRSISVAKSPGFQGKLKVASLGSGAGHMELNLLDQLLKFGVQAELDCVDFNPRLKDAAMRKARQMGLEQSFQFYVEDCNKLSSGRNYDVIIVNQFFHHVEDLKSFCGSIRRQLKPHGVLLTCDVVGRNGHVLWPGVDTVVQQWWSMLPEHQRFDRYFSRSTESYISVDHSAYSNEGIKAQEVVESLLDDFEFETFITYGAAIIPIIERRVGFNFDPSSETDTDTVSRIAEADRAAIQSGTYPASNMIAVLRHRGSGGVTRFSPISPSRFLESVQCQNDSVCVDSN